MGLRKTIAALALIAVAGIAYGVYLLVKDSQRANSFESVSLGMSEVTVVDTMGVPDDRHDGAETLLLGWVAQCHKLAVSLSSCTPPRSGQGFGLWVLTIAGM